METSHKNTYYICIECKTLMQECKEPQKNHTFKRILNANAEQLLRAAKQIEKMINLRAQFEEQFNNVIKAERIKLDVEVAEMIGKSEPKKLLEKIASKTQFNLAEIYRQAELNPKKTKTIKENTLPPTPPNGTQNNK